MNAFEGGELAAELDPDVWLWRRGVDYVAGWRAARVAAEELNAMLSACGIERGQLRAIADTDAQGRGVVRLDGVSAGWLRLVELLELADEVARWEAC